LFCFFFGVLTRVLDTLKIVFTSQAGLREGRVFLNPENFTKKSDLLTLPVQRKGDASLKEGEVNEVWFSLPLPSFFPSSFVPLPASPPLSLLLPP
jgi:hypothetical protein